MFDILFVVFCLLLVNLADRYSVRNPWTFILGSLGVWSLVFYILYKIYEYIW